MPYHLGAEAARPFGFLVEIAVWRMGLDAKGVILVALPRLIPGYRPEDGTSALRPDWVGLYALPLPTPRVNSLSHLATPKYAITFIYAKWALDVTSS
jgi:hypothetical protein